MSNTNLDQKIAHWLKTIGKKQTIQKLKNYLKSSEYEASNIVEKFISDNPGTPIASEGKIALNGLIYIVVMVIVCWAGCKACGNVTTTVEDMKFGAYTYTSAYVSAKLKSPATAKFKSEDDGDVEMLGNNDFKVKGYVDSQNSFGAVMRMNFSSVVHWNGKDINNPKNWRMESFTSDDGQ